MWNKAYSCNRQYRGFTLIELLVAILIGTLIVTVSLSMFQHSAKARGIVVSTTELQEEAYFISHTLGQQLAQMGHRGVDASRTAGRSLPIDTQQAAFPEVPGNWVEGQYLKIDATGLSMRYHGASDSTGVVDNSIYDCMGNPVAATQMSEVSLTLVSGQLVCNVGAASEILLGDTDGVQVEQIVSILGVDTRGDGVVDRSVSSAMATTADYLNVRHIALRILLATSDGTLPHNQTYTFNGITNTATDNRLRTEVSVSVAIRN